MRPWRGSGLARQPWGAIGQRWGDSELGHSGMFVAGPAAAHGATVGRQWVGPFNAIGGLSGSRPQGDHGATVGRPGATVGWTRVAGLVANRQATLRRPSFVLLVVCLVRSWRATIGQLWVRPFINVRGFSAVDRGGPWGDHGTTTGWPKIYCWNAASWPALIILRPTT